jgi:hypothetical protein
VTCEDTAEDVAAGVDEDAAITDELPVAVTVVAMEEEDPVPLVTAVPVEALDDRDDAVTTAPDPTDDTDVVAVVWHTGITFTLQVLGLQ